MFFFFTILSALFSSTISFIFRLTFLMVAKWILQLQTLLPPTILFRKKENVSFPSSQKCWASSCLDQISSYVHFWISHCNWTSYVYTDWKIGVGISLDFMEIVPWTRVSPPKCLPAMQWGVHDSLSTYPHLFNMPIGSFLIVKVSSLLYRKIAHNQQSKGSLNSMAVEVHFPIAPAFFWMFLASLKRF